MEIDDLRSFARIEEPPAEPSGSWGHNVHVHGGRRARQGDLDTMSVEEKQLPDRRIKVKTEVTLISSTALPYKDALY